jgi:hypothetical protein
MSAVQCSAVQNTVLTVEMFVLLLLLPLLLLLLRTDGGIGEWRIVGVFWFDIIPTHQQKPILAHHAHLQMRRPPGRMSICCLLGSLQDLGAAQRPCRDPQHGPTPRGHYQCLGSHVPDGTVGRRDSCPECCPHGGTIRRGGGCHNRDVLCHTQQYQTRTSLSRGCELFGNLYHDAQDHGQSVEERMKYCSLLEGN